jgi:ribosomal protein S18 acetylase RimI-like enzyme
MERYCAVVKAPVEIRPAVSADAAAVDRIALEAYAKYVPRIGREPAPMTADHGVLIARGEVWVAVRADELWGFVVLRAEPQSLLLESVAVSAPYRGRGVGRALIDFAERHARDLGLPSVELYTNALMTENLSYYPRLGYVEYDRRSEHGFDRVYFRKSV